MSAAYAESVDYRTQIEPLLRERCYECHSGDNVESGLDLSRQRSAMLRADSGEFAIVAGRPDQSMLLARASSHDESIRMPPEGERLAENQIRLLERWIREGANWPEPELEVHWAYVPPKPKALPEEHPEYRDWYKNSIDRLILPRMMNAELCPTSEAEPARLIRRLYLDLIGLPPSVEAVNSFLADSSNAHYEQIVERLLASPRYGEKWARHWLDLARYSDSNGYQADQIREMWAFRDWVIDALNVDMPYDQFTIEQLAGDLLPNARLSQKVATGFHRGTTCNVEAGVDPEENRTNQVIDRINTTGTTWLGTTLECAQCHNHKYDPISQEEYYQVFAFFNNTPMEVAQDSPGSVSFSMSGPKLELPIDPERTERLDQVRLEKKQLETQISEAKKGRNKKRDKNAKPEASSQLKLLQKQLQHLNQEESELAPATTMVMQELNEPRTTKMFVRGNFLSPGAAVEPDVPAVLNAFPPTLPKNRLGFARWLVDPNNPLTARVAVNRWWHEFFGRGIVSTLDDFGTQGEPPTHPELLDWLALFLQDSGWSMKSVHRLIVTSATYRQSASGSPDQRTTDAENIWLARGPRTRLSAELIRDNALSISGLLDDEMRGPPVYPPQPDGLWRQTGRNEPVFQAATDRNRFRRGVYVVWRRAAPYPSFVTFNAPDRMTCVAQRPNTNTPLQALTLLNDEAYVEAAKAMAARVMHDTQNRSLPSKMEYAIKLSLSRSPTSDEIELLVALYQEELMDLRLQPVRVEALLTDAGVLGVRIPDDGVEWAAWFSVCNAILNLDETISK